MSEDDFITVSLEKDTTETEELPAVDPDAPYGRLGNGRPRKTPPKNEKATKGGPEAPKGPPPRKPTTAKSKKDYHSTVQSLIENVASMAMFVSPVDGMILAHNAPTLAKGWGNLAEQNDAVARVLDKMSGTSAWGEAIGATLQTGIMLAAAHGVLDGTPVEKPMKAQLQQLMEQYGMVPKTEPEQAPPSNEGPLPGMNLNGHAPEGMYTGVG